MPDPKVVQGEEYQHGEVQAQEALEQANPIPDEELPPVQPEQVVEEALAPKEEEGPVPIHNLTRIPMTVPRMMSNAMPQQSFMREREWNAYLLFETLAKSPASDPFTKLIARRHLGED